MKIKILKNFKHTKRIAGVPTNKLKSKLKGYRQRTGPALFEDGTLLACVTYYYQCKCKSQNCFLIQKEFDLEEAVGHNQCYECHLQFLKLYEEGQIKAKKTN